MAIPFYKLEETSTGSAGNFWAMYSALTDNGSTDTGEFTYSSSTTSNYQYLNRLWKLAVSTLTNKGFAMRAEEATYDPEIGYILCAQAVGSTYWPDYGDSIMGVRFAFTDGIGNVMMVSMWHSSVTATTGLPPITLSHGSGKKFYVSVVRGMIYS